MIVLWILGGAAALLLLLLLAAVIRTLLIPNKQSTYQPDPDPARAAAYAEKLSAMVRCETVSEPGKNLREKFLAFHKVLEELFPLVHQQLDAVLVIFRDVLQSHGQCLLGLVETFHVSQCDGIHVVKPAVLRHYILQSLIYVVSLGKMVQME